MFEIDLVRLHRPGNDCTLPCAYCTSSGQVTEPCNEDMKQNRDVLLQVTRRDGYSKITRATVNLQGTLSSNPLCYAEVS